MAKKFFLPFCFEKWVKNRSNFYKIVGKIFGKNWVIFSAEWTYLLTTRKVGDEDSAFSFVRIKYGDHETDTVTGMIIYPDDFSFSEVGVATLKFGSKHGLQADIDKATWEALESAGCVFLPGSRHYYYKTTGSGTGTIDISEDSYGIYTFYWSSSTSNANNGLGIYPHFQDRKMTASSTFSRTYGCAVRLAQDYK